MDLTQPRPYSQQGSGYPQLGMSTSPYTYLPNHATPSPRAFSGSAAFPRAAVTHHTPRRASSGGEHEEPYIQGHAPSQPEKRPYDGAFGDEGGAHPRWPSSASGRPAPYTPQERVPGPSVPEFEPSWSPPPLSPPPLSSQIPAAALQPREVDAVLNDFPELTAEQRGIAHMLVKQATDVPRGLVIFQLVNHAQTMANASALASLKLQMSAVVESQQEQKKTTRKNWTLKVDSLARNSLLVMAKTYLSDPSRTDFDNLDAELVAYAQANAAMLDLEDVVVVPGLTPKLVSGAKAVANTAKEAARRAIRSSITGATRKTLFQFTIIFTSKFRKGGSPTPVTKDYIYYCARLRKYGKANFGLLSAEPAAEDDSSQADGPETEAGDADASSSSAPPPARGTAVAPGRGRGRGTAVKPARGRGRGGAKAKDAPVNVNEAFWKGYESETQQMMESCATPEIYIQRMEALVQADDQEYGGGPSLLQQLQGAPNGQPSTSQMRPVSAVGLAGLVGS